MQQQVWSRCAGVALLVACGSGEVWAADYFLTVGGGYGATSTQISLERNVLFQQRLLAEQRTDAPEHVVLFADGDDPAPDVQLRDPDYKKNCPAARQLLAELLGDDGDMDLVYRNNEIENVAGPSSGEQLKLQLRSLGQKLKAGDRLIIYATAHGGPAEKENNYYDYENAQAWRDAQEAEHNEFDTSLYFYDGESVKASEFSSWLDRLPRDVHVTLVMVQCYAGGFSHTLFHNADADLGLSNHARCGFFAQVHDRGAAGCTPNANESEYEEYSSYFWGALAGHSRTGDKTIAADYDGDGKVTFAEAHAYAVIESNTIDIPIRTSDAFLRKYSNLGKESGKAKDEESPLGSLFSIFGDKKPAEEDATLIELSGKISDIAKLARPDRKAIVEKLVEQLELGENATIESLKVSSKAAEAEANVARVRHATAYERYTQARQRVREELVEIWPELNVSYSPLGMALANERAGEFVAKVEGLASYDALCKAREGRSKGEDKANELTHREAKMQRLLHTCESIVLAANLPKLMPQELVDRYEALVGLEEEGL